MHEAQRSAVIDGVHVGHLLVASRQLARPIRPVLRVALGARLPSERRAATPSAMTPAMRVKKAAARRHKGYGLFGSVILVFLPIKGAAAAKTTGASRAMIAGSKPTASLPGRASNRRDSASVRDGARLILDFSTASSVTLRHCPPRGQHTREGCGSPLCTDLRHRRPRCAFRRLSWTWFPLVRARSRTDGTPVRRTFGQPAHIVL